MGLSESRTRPCENQAVGQRRRPARRPRTRRCLLKGCEQRFQPGQPQQRYCSQRCREAARWSLYISSGSGGLNQRCIGSAESEMGDLFGVFGHFLTKQGNKVETGGSSRTPAPLRQFRIGGAPLGAESL